MNVKANWEPGKRNLAAGDKANQFQDDVKRDAVSKKEASWNLKTPVCELFCCIAAY